MAFLSCDIQISFEIGALTIEDFGVIATCTCYLNIVWFSILFIGIIISTFTFYRKAYKEIKASDFKISWSEYLKRSITVAVDGCITKYFSEKRWVQYLCALLIWISCAIGAVSYLLVVIIIRIQNNVLGALGTIPTLLVLGTLIFLVVVLITKQKYLLTRSPALTGAGFSTSERRFILRTAIFRTLWQTLIIFPMITLPSLPNVITGQSIDPQTTVLYMNLVGCFGIYMTIQAASYLSYERVVLEYQSKCMKVNQKALAANKFLANFSPCTVIQNTPVEDTYQRFRQDILDNAPKYLSTFVEEYNLIDTRPFTKMPQNIGEISIIPKLFIWVFLFLMSCLLLGILVSSGVPISGLYVVYSCIVLAVLIFVNPVLTFLLLKSRILFGAQVDEDENPQEMIGAQIEFRYSLNSVE